MTEAVIIENDPTELGAPPPLAPDVMRIIPLGGLGEIGRNMAVLEYGSKLLVIDCGVLFPEDRQIGIDLILPDFSYLQDRLDDIESIILTHGHEDHIGGVPYLLRLKPDIPLIGSTLTLAFVEAKLKEFKITPYSLTVKEGDIEQIGTFKCEFVAVNHSIPDALAVAVHTDAGTVLHTGDFKMDQLPLDGRITDLRHFAKLGESGVDLLMIDSTNAEVPGFVTSEAEIGPVIDSVFASATRRIIVASFASHVHRVQQVLDAAAAHNRKVAFVGRSMIRNMGIAADLGYLTIPEGVLIDLKDIGDYRDDELVLMSTGSQGEPMAALSRMANGDHKVSVGPGDTVILASSLIPGNENSVFRVINGLTRLGAKVVHSGNAKVHVSGHSAAGELLYCYNILQPKNVLPVHGEYRHLVANGALAIKAGVPPEHVIIAEDGYVIDLADGLAQLVGKVPCEYVYVDGSTVGETTEAELNDRRLLGEKGLLSVVAAVDLATGKVVGSPHIQTRGLVDDDAIFEKLFPKITTALEAELATGTKDLGTLEHTIRKVVTSWVAGHLRRKPMIVPLIISA